MRIASENTPDAQAPDVDMPQKKNYPHPINQPISTMGQEKEGVTKNDQQTVLRNSPETEGSLTLLGAGSPYHPTYMQGD